MISSSHEDVTIALLVPRNLVKTVKTILEGGGRLSHDRKIKPAKQNDGGELVGERYVVPASIPRSQYQSHKESGSELASWEDILRSLGLRDYLNQIDELAEHVYNTHVTLGEIRPYDSGGCPPNPSTSGGRSSPLIHAFNQWIDTLPKDALDKVLCSDAKSRTTLLLPSSFTYSIYPPLLLLPPNFFSKWPSAFLSEAFQPERVRLFNRLCHASKTTHVALNGPIARGSSDPGSTSMEDPVVLRSPTGFQPLYGDFGPALVPKRHPTHLDFEQSFWCTSRQNGIYQTWAHRYTMFSRGNISEKARVLHLRSLQPDRLGCPPEETSAVDLYAGIGYFAFSYAKAGVGKVFGWEINPWSLEGLRRGARDNKWRTTLCRQGEEVSESALKASRIVAFEESNQEAPERLLGLRGSVPPVRHVNCGYLPSSEDSWRTAFEVLDPILGGWIHAHENVEEQSLSMREKQVLEFFSNAAGERSESIPGRELTVTCEHVERVKSYAPGVSHFVFDIAIRPLMKSA